MQSIVYYSARIYFLFLSRCLTPWARPRISLLWIGFQCASVCARPTIAINSRYIIIISGCGGDGTGTKPKDILSSDSTSTSSDHNIHVIFSLLSSSSFSDQKKKTNKQCRIYYYYFSFATQSDCFRLQWVDAQNFFSPLHKSEAKKKQTNEQIVNSLLFAMWMGKRMGCQRAQPANRLCKTVSRITFFIICWFVPNDATMCCRWWWCCDTD